MLSAPLVGSELMITDCRLLAGESLGSKMLPVSEAKSEPLVAKLKVAFSLMVLALSAPTGWLLTGVIVIDMVLAGGAELLLPVAPVSVTVNVKVGAAMPPAAVFLSAGGVNRNWPALSCASVTVWAPLIVAAPSLSVPPCRLAGVMVTEASVLLFGAGSCGSLNGKSAAEK